ncbi:unknown protein [Oryza sativa Japonica Group]|uniref:Os01g0736000 protein n=2 Tax=Oryza sativa subsp. japonica TaxID=39947 RepID=Q0JJJ3_ORYSJ|nr:hypothetical protein EE612_005564 [Oryza sativa]BAD87809.1 unknown protein [Oryza sativa Japonica Group]BAF06085.1 Os01g0736000 [Oryza sativa Japonica Group]BAS74223.1 Os01g0736000 [Oryza sativa Japonica Group]|eukprot:NP_001044171.1 Os01g0736000 [Oryza sativa Japonica Group]
MSCPRTPPGAATPAPPRRGPQAVSSSPRPPRPARARPRGTSACSSPAPRRSPSAAPPAPSSRSRSRGRPRSAAAARPATLGTPASPLRLRALRRPMGRRRIISARARQGGGSRLVLPSRRGAPATRTCSPVRSSLWPAARRKRWLPCTGPCRGRAGALPASRTPESDGLPGCAARSAPSARRTRRIA